MIAWNDDQLNDCLISWNLATLGLLVRRAALKLIDVPACLMTIDQILLPCSRSLLFNETIGYSFGGLVRRVSLGISRFLNLDFLI